MSMGGQARKPRFFWQGLLIVLPLVVLAALGIVSLRQDRKLVEGEVRERSRQFTAAAADRCWKRLATLGASELAAPPLAIKPGLFQVSSEGELIMPPHYPSVPIPNFTEVTRLKPQQADLWRRVEVRETTDAPVASRIAHLRSFLGTQPPLEYTALAHFWLAKLLRQSDTKQAMDECQVVIHQFAQSVGETGVPLAPLAMIQLAEMSLPAVPSPTEANHAAAIKNSGLAIKTDAPKQVDEFPASLSSNMVGQLAIRATLDQLCSNAVAQPSVLTPWMLEWAVGREQSCLQSTNLTERWRSMWHNEEQHRLVFKSAYKTLLEKGVLARIDTVSVRPQPANTRPKPSWPEAFWLNQVELPSRNQDVFPALPTTHWLAIKSQSLADGAAIFVYRSPAHLLEVLREFDQEEKSLPAYLGVYYQIAGKIFGGSHWSQFAARHKMIPAVEGELVETTLPHDLLSQTGHQAGDGTTSLAVAVALLEPAALYARQSQRVFWFGLLLGTAILVAMVGLVSTWKTFRQQQRLYQMQSDFVSSVTHELHAPIGAVRLMAENFARGKVREPNEQQQFFQYMVQECGRLSAMIENVLNLARIEQGRQEYEFAPTDIVRLVEDTLKLIQPNAVEAKVLLNLDLDPTQFSNLGEGIILDGRAMQQVLVNLLDNALKHSPDGSTVCVGMQLCAGNAGALASPCGRLEACPTTLTSSGAASGDAHTSSFTFLHLWVADQGPGIPPAERLKIFERFYRRGTELRRETPGIGIGLNIVKHIVEAHRGKVWVESAPGHGSRFVLELPLTQRRMDASAG